MAEETGDDTLGIKAVQGAPAKKNPFDRPSSSSSSTSTAAKAPASAPSTGGFIMSTFSNNTTTGDSSAAVNKPVNFFGNASAATGSFAFPTTFGSIASKEGKENTTTAVNVVSGSSCGTMQIKQKVKTSTVTASSLLPSPSPVASAPTAPAVTESVHIVDKISDYTAVQSCTGDGEHLTNEAVFEEVQANKRVKVE